MKVISTTYEATTAEHMYRFFEDATGVAVKRVPIAHPFWSHGVLSQMCVLKDEKPVFVPTINVTELLYFRTLNDAAQLLDA